MPRTALPARADSERLVTDLYILVLADQEVFIPQQAKIKFPWVLVCVTEQNHREVRCVCSLLLLLCRTQGRAASDNPPGKQPQFTSQEVKVTGE